MYFAISKSSRSPCQICKPDPPRRKRLFHPLPAHLAAGAAQASQTHLSPSSSPYAALCHPRGVLHFEDGRRGSDCFGQWWVKCPSLVTHMSCWALWELRAELEDANLLCICNDATAPPSCVHMSRFCFRYRDSGIKGFLWFWHIPQNSTGLRLEWKQKAKILTDTDFGEWHSWCSRLSKTPLSYFAADRWDQYLYYIKWIQTLVTLKLDQIKWKTLLLLGDSFLCCRFLSIIELGTFYLIIALYLHFKICTICLFYFNWCYFSQSSSNLSDMQSG